jgi:hypothetical protein
MTTRKNSSRSKELDIAICTFSDDSESFKEYILNNPKGGYYLKNNCFFKYGNIERLIDSINWNIKNFKSPLKFINGIYHLDSIPKEEKKRIEITYNLSSGILTYKSKADLLITTQNDLQLLSFKDGDSISKLGQLSAEMNYNKAVLRGGLILPFSDVFTIENKEINHNNTSLTPAQFNKLSYQDKYFATIKKNQKDMWLKYINDSYQEAVDQLIKFGNTMSTDTESLVRFILVTLFGRVNIPNYYNLMINDKLILSNKIISFFEEGNYEVKCEHYETANKFSLIIKIIHQGKQYGITKIEPAFDGAKENVSQTKGIIFYFQQYPASQMHIWQLLKHISK